MFVIKLKLGKFNSTFYSKKPDKYSATWELICVLNNKFKGTAYKILEIFEK
jgi:hypothetical protein